MISCRDFDLDRGGIGLCRFKEAVDRVEPEGEITRRKVHRHEVYGAIYAREMGDSTFECETPAALCDMIDTLINDKAILRQLNKRIVELKNFGVYNGGYEVVKLAIEGKK